MEETAVVVLLQLDIKLHQYQQQKQLVVPLVSIIIRRFILLQVLALLQQHQIGHQQL
jgi:hypothetical protein|tara:strand:- start:617 stop:787 length:171 start_codon:yes stop_codon:yes gene_type:complete